MYSQEKCIKCSPRDCIRIFIAELSIIFPKWKPLQCQSIVEEINKLNENEQSQTTHNNMDESQVILREKNQVPKSVYYMIPLFKAQT